MVPLLTNAPPHGKRPLTAPLAAEGRTFLEGGLTSASMLLRWRAETYPALRKTRPY